MWSKHKKKICILLAYYPEKDNEPLDLIELDHQYVTFPDKY